MKTTNPSRLAREIAEMAGAQRRLGIMDEATYEKITAHKSEAMAAVHEMMEGFHQSGAIDTHGFILHAWLNRPRNSGSA